MVERSVVGLEIASNAIRAVEVKQPGGKRLQVLRAHAVVLEPGAAADGVVLDPDQCYSALRQLWSEGGFQSRNVALVVGNRHTVIRQVTLPRLAPRLLAASLPFQAAEHIPLPASELLLDFYPLADHDDDARQQVTGLLTGVMNDQVQTNVDVLRSAKLKVVKADLLPFGIVRAHRHLAESTGRREMLVTVSADTTYLTVVRDGTPELMRVVAVGTADVEAAVREFYRSEAHPVLETMRTVGLYHGANTEFREVSERMLAEVRVIADAIRGTAGFLREEPEAADLQVVISGAAGQVRGFARAIQDLTGLPTSTSQALGRAARGQGLDGAGADLPEQFEAAFGVTLPGGKK